MTTSIRFYDADGIDTGENYTGRWVLTLDPIDLANWTAGDGNTNELDLAFEDPFDSTKIFNVGVYTDTDGSISDATVRAGFTFDSASPTLWDGGYVYRASKANWASWGYTFPYGGIYDGAWDGPFDTHVALAIDPASDPDWENPAPLPAWSTPTITSPASGSSFSAGDDVIPLTWTTGTGTQVEKQLRLVGDLAGAPNPSVVLWAGPATTDGTATGDVLLPYPGSTGAAHAQVRVRPSNPLLTWSAWADLPVDLTAAAGFTTVDCLDDECLADSPYVLYLFRDASDHILNDSSGVAYDGVYNNTTAEWRTKISDPLADWQPPLPQQTPAPVCDAGCADDNYFADGSHTLSGGALFQAGTIANYLPNSNWHSEELTLELLVRLSGSGSASFQLQDTNWVGAAITAFIDGGSVVGGGTWRYSNGAVTEISGDPIDEAGCWMHLVLVRSVLGDGSGHLALRVNGEVVASFTNTDPSAFILGYPHPGPYLELGLGNADVALAAMYDHALSADRIAAHFSHLCNLCPARLGAFRLGAMSFN